VLPVAGSSRVRVQPLGIGEHGDITAQRSRGFWSDSLVRHPSDEIICRQPRPKPCGAVGGQDVVGARHVVAEDNRTRRAQENRPGVPCPNANARRIFDGNEEMFGRPLIGERDRFLQRRDDENRTALTE